MGLCISCKHSEQELNWGYHTLHLIRDLALKSCGVDKELCSIMRSCHSDDVDIVRFVMAYHPEVQIKSSDFFGCELAGYYYPNLLFHSDCDGTYTSNGKVMTDTYWTKGNIKKLKKELELLLSESKLIQDDTAKEYAQQLLDLVSDELTYKCPRIYFS